VLTSRKRPERGRGLELWEETNLTNSLFKLGWTPWRGISVLKLREGHSLINILAPLGG
jgi:hypothetical protein